MPEDRTGVADLRVRVDAALTSFLAGQRPVLDGIAGDLEAVADAASEFLLQAGKRLRPAFCYWGWRGTGAPDGDGIVTAAAALELLHAGALIHDDVMDRSDTRRGAPAVHRRFARLHAQRAWRGDPDAFGTAVAILLGDLCLFWADVMLSTAALPAESLARGRQVFDRMRVELMSGQYLDVLEQAVGGGSVDRALRVARYKTAKYTVERPLLLGGALAGGDPELCAGYARFGESLGIAFQLRDDVLGVFGDPDATGKPAGDDLREGKRTVLIATALAAADPRRAHRLEAGLGDPTLDDDGITALRDVIRSTGALDEVERLIHRHTDDALAALAATELAPAARAALEQLAAAATVRTG